MDRKLGRITTAAVFTLFSASSIAQSPFCLVSNSGQASCFYYSLDACQQARASLGGMCAANVQQQPAQPQPIAPLGAVQQRHPDVAGAYQRGQAAGMAARQAHRIASTPVVFYDCRPVGGDGFTDIPAVGCAVVFIQP